MIFLFLLYIIMNCDINLCKILILVNIDKIFVLTKFTNDNL